NDAANFAGQTMGAVFRREIGLDCVGAGAGLADFCSYGFCFFRAAVVVNQNLRTRLCECERGSAAHTARSACDEGCLTRKVGHVGLPCLCEDRPGPVCTSITRSASRAVKRLC